jgi:hypothetical protein
MDTRTGYERHIIERAAYFQWQTPEYGPRRARADVV